MQPLRKRAVIVRIISALLIFSLCAPHPVVFSAPAKEKILFLGVMEKDNSWMDYESLKWFKMSLLSPKYEWTSVENVENFSGTVFPSDFQQIAENHKQENAVKIIYGKINETEISKRKNGVAVTASFYIYDIASKSTREISLTGISPQMPGYSGSEEFLYNEALKDLSSELVSVLDENVSPAERDTKKLAKKKTKKSSSRRHSYFEDDNISGSDFLDMVMGAALLYMVFFHRTGGSSGSSSGSNSTTSSSSTTTTTTTSSSGCGPTFQGTGSQKTCIFSANKPWSIKYQLTPQKVGSNNFIVNVEDKNGNVVSGFAISKTNISQSESGSSQTISASGDFLLDIGTIDISYTLTIQSSQ